MYKQNKYPCIARFEPTEWHKEQMYQNFIQINYFSEWIRKARIDLTNLLCLLKLSREIGDPETLRDSPVP